MFEFGCRISGNVETRVFEFGCRTRGNVETRVFEFGCRTRENVETRCINALFLFSTIPLNTRYRSDFDRYRVLLHSIY